MTKPTEINVDFPRALQFLFEPARYKVAHGGRGGAKSWGFARALLIMAAAHKRRVLCAREFQQSIQDSVHKLLKEQIELLELGHLYEVQQSVIRGSNGSEFIFSGLHGNPTKIKSMEGVDIVWVEEAETVSDESWRVLIPTIRKKMSEIWVSFNPREASDPTYKRFVDSPPPGAVVKQILWKDNPWFPDELRREMEYLYATDPEAAEHIWGGQVRTIGDAQVLRGRYRVESFTPREGWAGPYYGGDWGFATDPTALVRCWVDTKERVLYIEHEAYGIGVDLDDTPELFDRVPESRKHIIRADNARPETISHLKKKGFPRLEAVTKWPGSVEDGVEFLRSFKAIIIHPRCTHTAEEARLYSYKTDRLTGEVRPEIVDKHNHCMDSLRYALSPLIRNQAVGEPTALNSVLQSLTGASPWSGPS